MTKTALKLTIVLCLALSVCIGCSSSSTATPRSYYENTFSTLKTQAQTHLAEQGRPDQTYAVGIAPPMTRIYHEGGPALAWNGTIEITTARGESEYRELAIIPMIDANDVTDITVSVSPMVCAANNHTLDPATEVKAGPVGYVMAEAMIEELIVLTPPHAVPDVLWAGMTGFTAYRDQLQGAFIQFDIDQNTPAGTYTGQVTVAPQGLNPESFDIELTVLDFVLPYGGPIPAHISGTKRQLLRDHRCVSGWWDPPIPDKNGDGVVDFYELEHLDQTDIDAITRSIEEFFAVPGNNYMMVATPGTFEGGNLIGGFQDKYDEYTPSQIDAIKNYWRIMGNILAERDLLDNAVAYVWGEPTDSVLDEVQTRCQWVHDADPRIRTHVEDIHNNCRPLRQAGYINHHILLSPHLDPIADAPENWAPGTSLGMYVCVLPLGSYPNLMVDDSLLDCRVLGWQMAQRHVQRFLYWGSQASFWIGKNSQNFPRTDCGSMGNYGDGTLVHSPNGGSWYPSHRLRNFADGMEDFIYITTLQNLMEQSDPANPAIPNTIEWQNARAAGAAALAQVQDVVGTSMNTQTHDTQTLLNARNDIANAIITLNALLGPIM
ncbi:MAG: DUF4091 domain-containing protein [Sedimentisphaerales bacterium]|nr:DUF4091 domain-containing protein [Sedimentisphaerales bacterium]